MRSKLTVLLTLISVISFSQESFLQSDFSDLKYRNIGPTRGGRVTAVAGVESQPSVFYMGATGGGVWKTEDYGKSWQNISDGYFSTGSIGSIRVYQKNPEIIYVGTGSDGIRSNVIIGKGVYRSDDSGQSWSFIGLKKAGQIGAVLIHPDDPDICYVAAIGNPFGANDERGVFKTTNGGETWEKVLFISENTGSCDIEFCPDNPDIIYASVWTARRKPWTIISGSEEGGIYKTVNGGESWNKLGGGLPLGLVGKSDLAVCKTNPELLYVLVEAADNKEGLYISNDRGANFKLVSQAPFLIDRPFYYTNIDVDPTNPDIIYSNSTGYYRSSDMGNNWTRRSTPHGDNHDMWINPSNPDIFIQSNDGGANITIDGGTTWSRQDNQPTAELYQVNLDDQFPYWVYAGQQDNSTIAITSAGATNRRTPTYFMSVGGCETGPAVPKPGNHNIVYSNCKGRFGRYSKLTGLEKQYYVGAANLYGHNPADLKYRFQRVSPIIVSPHDPGIVYHASQYLHVTYDEGVTWETISPDLTAFEPDKQVVSGSPITRDITGEEYYSTIYAVAESPLQKGVIWTGANDGLVHLTKDGGENWVNVTPADLPPGGRVQTVEASPHNPAKAYIAVYRYLLNDWEPYIFMTADYGKSWKRLTSGMNGIKADNPTRVVREDPEIEGLLYAGTESGVFVSFDEGKLWVPFQQNLPVVPVTDIRIFREDLVLSTMGRSFWIMDNISPLHYIKESVQTFTGLFRPRDAFRTSRQSAIIDYYLSEKADRVNLKIVDAKGELVYEFSSVNGGNSSEVGQQGGGRFNSSTQTARLASGKGFHRLNWDMRTFGAETDDGQRSGRGPTIIPGRYRIILDVDGNSNESFIEVLPDPKIIADGITYGDFEEQYLLAIEVRNLISSTNNLRSEIDEIWLPVKEKIDEGERVNRGEMKDFETITLLRKEIVTDELRYPQPMLSDQLNYLYSMITRTDQKPGNEAYTRYRDLETKFKYLKEQLELIIEQD